MSTTVIPQALLAAYNGAEYWVSMPVGAFCMQIGAPSGDLTNLLRREDALCAGLISAENPLGRPCPAPVNAKAHEQLRQILVVRYSCVMDTIARDPARTWPDERGYLALGLGVEETMKIGRLFQQNAVVWAGPDTVPKLILLR